MPPNVNAYSQANSQSIKLFFSFKSVFFIFLLPILFAKKKSEYFDNHCSWKPQALHNMIKRHLNMLLILCVAGLVDKVVTQYLGHLAVIWDVQKRETTRMTLKFALFSPAVVIIEDCIVPRAMFHLWLRIYPFPQ